MNYQGDFLEDATVYIPFNTFDSNDPSASVTITNLAQGDVEIWKNGVVQATPGSGVTLTLNIGTNNGTHLIAVDTSDVTDAGFYAINADYQVRINGTTIDGATVNAWVGTFSIENRFKEVDVAAISGDATAADNLEAVLLGTGDTADVDLVARSLKLNNDADVALEVLSSDDSAIKAVSTASGKHGMELAGNVAGDGLRATGGSTGMGIHALGGSTSGSGLYAEAQTDGDGIDVIGKGNATNGIYAEGGAVSGAGIHAQGGSTSGNGITAEAQTDGDGIFALAKGAGEHGIYAKGGDTSGDGIHAEAQTEGDGIYALAKGTNQHGILAVGGNTSGDGIHANAAAGNGNGMSLVKHGTGKDLDADEIDNILTDTNEIQGKLPTNKFMGSSDGADDDGTLNTIATDTTTDIPALIATAQSDLDIITGESGVLIDTDAVDADDLKADAITEIWAKAMTDLAQGAPSATASVFTAINYLYEAWRNKKTVTATLETTFKNDGTTGLTKSTVSDNGTTFTKAEQISGA